VIAGSGPLDGVTLEDGEGILSFPPGTRIRGRITIAAEGPAFLSTYGVPPDFEILNTSAGIPDMRHQGMFAMANRADQLVLKQGNLVLQEVRWPEEVAAREGQIHYLENGTWTPGPGSLASPGFSRRISRGHRHGLRLSGRGPRGPPGCHPECLPGDPGEHLRAGGCGQSPASWPGRSSGGPGGVLLEGGPAGGSPRVDRARHSS